MSQFVNELHITALPASLPPLVCACQADSTQQVSACAAPHPATARKKTRPPRLCFESLPWLACTRVLLRRTDSKAGGCRRAAVETARGVRVQYLGKGGGGDAEAVGVDAARHVRDVHKFFEAEQIVGRRYGRSTRCQGHGLLGRGAK
jgi:hypothetical protein